MKRLLSVLLTFVCAQGLLAQVSSGQINSIAMPSTNNSFLGRTNTVSEFGVDLFTGTAQVNVPICALSGKEVNVPVSLNYTGGRGIRVQDNASIVGLGWQLSAGGGISRVVKGFPDENPNGYLGTGLWGQQVANAGNNNTAVPTAISGTSESIPTADGEPDVFFIKTPFFSVQFVFDEFGNPVFSANSGLKVYAYNFYNSTSYANSWFKVVDLNGTSYYFGSSSSSVEKSTAKMYENSITFPTTWYLDRINTFNNKEDITFSYIAGVSNELTHYNTDVKFDYSCGRITENNNDVITVASPKFVSLMQSALGEINFNYAFDRRDNNDARLVSITHKAYNSEQMSNTTTLQTYTFNYTYFGDPTTDKNQLRLKLENISIAGNPTVNPPVPAATVKTFTYNTAVNLPNRTAQSFDYWGYHNNIQATDDPFLTTTLRAANNTKAQANILTDIVDLSGKKSSITYELNSFVLPNTGGQTDAGGGLRVKQTSQSLPTGENLFTNYIYTDDNGVTTGQPYSSVYKNLTVFHGDPQSYQVLSENKTNVYDINGTFVGYSSVKVVDQNGGYAVSKFKNFSDFPDLFNGPISVPAATSLAYKRGSITNNTVYNASNAKITEDIYNYTSLTLPVQKKGWGLNAHFFYYHVKCCTEWFVICISNWEGAVYSNSATLYSYLVEDYRLSQTVRKEYDQLNAANYLQTVTDYTYANDKLSIKAVSNTDSRGNVVTKTIYRANDPVIPMVNAAEQAAITIMQNANRLGVVIHEVITKNGATSELHNSYTTNLGGSNSRVFLTATSAYKGGALISQQNYNYDNIYATLVTSNAVGGKPTATYYGYNNVYPVASISNASTYYAMQQSTGNGSFNSLYTSFTADYAGTIYFSIGYLSGNGTYKVNYTLTGPTTRTGTLCLSTNAPSNCAGFSNGVTFNSMPAGTYSLSITPIMNTFQSLPYISYSYPKYNPVLTNEFYYQNFEDGNTPLRGQAHTGTGYHNATVTPYAVNFTIPNSRTYIMQWWNWSSGKWQMNEQSYTGPTSLTGIIDDIRIFPSDAQMETYTYSPMVGKTGEIDVSGRSKTYEYDAMGRLNIVRDDDKNILSKTCYTYAGQPVICPTAVAYTNTQQTVNFTRNNCSAGYVGSQVAYSIPAGTYTSYVSQADADQQALNQIALNGQAYANNPANGGLCNIPVTYNNQTSVYWNFTAVNTSTGTSYSSVLGSNYNGTLSVSLPAGTYTFTLSSSSQTTPTPPQFTVNGVVQNATATTNITATFTNVVVSTSSTNPLITIVLQASSAPCSFSAASGWSIATSGISASSGVVNFYIVLIVQSAVGSWSSPNTVATVNGGCRPSANRTFTKTDQSGRTWSITVYTSGQMTIQLLSGTPPSTGSSFSLSGCSYPQ